MPPEVKLADARDALPAVALFRHRKTGSYATFADWFRYSVLARCGGVWADTDCVCLRPLKYAAEIYAWDDELQINNAILGLPARHELVMWMADNCARPNRFLPYDSARIIWRKLRRRAHSGSGRDRVKWGKYGPMGFTVAARYLGYADRALPPWHFYPVHYREWRLVFAPDQPGVAERLARSSVIHLSNERMRREPGFDKNARFPPTSLFEQLCGRYLRKAD